MLIKMTQKRGEVILQQKERTVTGERFLNKSEEMGSRTRTELSASFGSWVVHAPY